MGNHFRENIKLTMKLFDALISPILFYASEVCGIDCNGKLEKDPAESVQNKFLKRTSHGKLKLANSCWQTQVGGVNGAKTVDKHVGKLMTTNRTCLPTVFAPFRHTNWSLPTRVCQL